MTYRDVLHKMGWCFTCDTNDCRHIQNANQSLAKSFSRLDGEVFIKNGKIIPADDVYLDPRAAPDARGPEIRGKKP